MKRSAVVAAVLLAGALPGVTVLAANPKPPAPAVVADAPTVQSLAAHARAVPVGIRPPEVMRIHNQTGGDIRSGLQPAARALQPGVPMQRSRPSASRRRSLRAELRPVQGHADRVRQHRHQGRVHVPQPRSGHVRRPRGQAPLLLLHRHPARRPPLEDLRRHPAQARAARSARRTRKRSPSSTCSSHAGAHSRRERGAGPQLHTTADWQDGRRTCGAEEPARVWWPSCSRSATRLGNLGAAAREQRGRPAGDGSVRSRRSRAGGVSDPNAPRRGRATPALKR